MERPSTTSNSPLPDWLASPSPPIERTTGGLPSWLSVPDPPAPKVSPEGKALLIRQFEMVFPRVLESMYAGATLANAVRELPIPIDVGAFTRWIMKDPSRKVLLQEAKVIRAEAWTGLMMKHALGEDENGDAIPVELDRSKFIVDTLKWLVSRENRKDYGDTKTIEMNTTISITAALNQANERVINATLVEDDDDIEMMDSASYKQLPAAQEDEGE